MSDDVRLNPWRVPGLILMIAGAAWIALNVLFTLGIGIAWIGETGLTDELQPWLIALFLTGTISASLGYAAVFLGRWLRGRT
jgi:hypothetical protein